MNITRTDRQFYTEIQPGTVWCDTEGKPIQAHCGGVLFDRWTPSNLRDFRYVWLPAEFSETGELHTP